MAIDSAQKRMSAISPACPWRGPMVAAAESSFSAGNRGAAVFLYSGLFSGAGSSAAIGFFPHRFFLSRYFPDRYFPGTGGAAASFGRPLEWKTNRRRHEWSALDRETGWVTNRHKHEWGRKI